MGTSGQEQIIHVRTFLVEPNREQPRKTFDSGSIEALADSVRDVGILQPILVEQADGYYRIIAGERRWRAAMLLHLPTVPVIIKDITQEQADGIALLENLQREDLNPIEEGAAYARYCERYGITQDELAKRLSTTRSVVGNAIRLLSLSDEVRDMVADGRLSAGHARTLLSVRDPQLQKQAAEKIISDGMSVREAEQYVRDAEKQAVRKKASVKPVFSASWDYLEHDLSQKTGSKVSIRRTKHGNSLKIDFLDDEKLGEVYEALMGM